MISTKKLQIVPDFLYPSDCFNHSRISCSLPATQGQYFVIKILCFSRGPTVPHSAMSSGHLLPHVLGQGLCLRKCWLPSHEHRVRKEEISKDLNDFSGARYNKTSFSGFLPNGLCLPSNTSLTLLSPCFLTGSAHGARSRVGVCPHLHQGRGEYPHILKRACQKLPPICFASLTSQE